MDLDLQCFSSFLTDIPASSVAVVDVFKWKRLSINPMDWRRNFLWGKYKCLLGIYLETTVYCRSLQLCHKPPTYKVTCPFNFSRHLWFCIPTQCIMARPTVQCWLYWLIGCCLVTVCKHSYRGQVSRGSERQRSSISGQCADSGERSRKGFTVLGRPCCAEQGKPGITWANDGSGHAFS